MSEPTDIETRLLDLKNTSELMIDLAYTALLYDSEEIAEEVQTLEVQQDTAHTDLQRQLFQAVKEGTVNPDTALALANLALATENVADAARDIADVVLRDVEPHPIFRVSMAESDTMVRRYVVGPSAPLEGLSLGDARVQTETGMLVFALRRGSTWMHGPAREVTITVGDVILARGPANGAARLGPLLGVPTGEESE